MLNLGSVSFCPGGGSTSGTVSITASPGVSWTAELGWSSVPPLSATLDRTSGVGSGTVTITIRGGASLYSPPCLGTTDRPANAIVITTSDGQGAGVPVWFGVTGSTVD
jgi:hypothetical protein